MNRIRLAIFDLDGTLVNAYPAIEKSFNYAMRMMGYPQRNYMTVLRAVGAGDEKLLARFVKKPDLKRAVSLYRKHHKASLLRYSGLMPGAKFLLNYFKKKGCKLAVASNRPTKFSKILIRHLDIEKYFDYSLCADKLKAGKPHPEILLKIMRRFHVKKDQSLYVGDMLIDAQAGKRAGIKTAIVTTGSSTISEIKRAKPWRIVKNLHALLKEL